MTTDTLSIPKLDPVRYKTIRVNELDIFYREAGPQTAPTFLLFGLIPKNWTVEKCSSAQVKGAEGNEEKSVQ
jgi:hypothetical protein